MSKKDYREKIEEHRQSIEIEKPNSRQSRSRVAKNKKPRRRDPLMTILTVIFIFIPLVVLVYVWGFYTPPNQSQAQGNEELLEYEKNNKVEDEKDEPTTEEPVLVDDTVDVNKEEDDKSEEDKRDVEQDDQNTKTDDSTSKQETNTEKDNKPVQEDPVTKGEHKVQVGDTLFSIARKNNTTVEAIMEANRLQTPDIQVGQVLIIP